MAFNLSSLQLIFSSLVRIERTMRLSKPLGADIATAILLSIQPCLGRTLAHPVPEQSKVYDYVGMCHYKIKPYFPHYGHRWLIHGLVVGGGTAGLTIASRLAKFASVAVVEAGGFYEQDNGNLSTVPGLSLTIPFVDTTPSYPRNSRMD
jgi:hypothetical protein